MSGFPSFFEKVARAGRLPKDVTPHVLRHSFASVAVDLGFSELTIGALIGHRGGSITSRYTHHADAVLLAAADQVAAHIALLMTNGASDDRNNIVLSSAGIGMTTKSSIAARTEIWTACEALNWIGYGDEATYRAARQVLRDAIAQGKVVAHGFKVNPYQPPLARETLPSDLFDQFPRLAVDVFGETTMMHPAAPQNIPQWNGIIFDKKGNPGFLAKVGACPRPMDDK